MGRRSLESSQRHVWISHLGCEEKTLGRRPGCHGDQTDLLQNRRRPVDLRIGNPPDCCRRRFQAEGRPGRIEPVSPVPLHAVTFDHFSRYPETRARDHVGCRGRKMAGRALVQLYAGSFFEA